MTVSLYRDDAEALVAETTTNGGHYQFHESTVGGTYRLRINGQWWPAAASWAAATPIVLTAASPTTADMVLAAQATLTGTIVDDAGPAVNVIV